MRRPSSSRRRRCGAPRSASAARLSSASSPSSSAASKSSARTSASSAVSLVANVASSRAVSGSGSDARVRSRLTAAAGSSIRASGLPAASARIRPFSPSEQAGPVPLEERARRVVVQPGKDELGEAGLVEIARHAVADGEEQDHRLHLEPPREERQHLGRRPIEPVRILDDEQQRCLRLALGDHAERRQADQEDIGRIALGDAEGDVESPALRIRKSIQAVEEGQQELVEPPEGEPRLGLRPRRPSHRRASLARPIPGGLEQRRLPDSRLTTDHQGAPTPPDPIDHPVEALQLPLDARGATAGRALRPSDRHRQATHAHPRGCRQRRQRRRDRFPISGIVRDRSPGWAAVPE